MRNIPREQEYVHTLLQLTLNPVATAEPLRLLTDLSVAEQNDFLSLANDHHVVIRAFSVIESGARLQGFRAVAEWAAECLRNERARIENALHFLSGITTELENAGCPTTVMKSLDHWPDLGNDLDLYTTADERRVVTTMVGKFQAHVEARSWGDRLANKWNFAIPGLPEAVEVHAKRLGQTGEHVALARRFVTRRVSRQIGTYTFLVPAPEERVIVATLQRMYRHFYFRVCDLVNTAALVDAGSIDYRELCKAAERGGIWPGVATFLLIASDYAKRYRGTELPLPIAVRQAASFGGEKLEVKAKFLRIPMMPEGAALYGKQVARTALRGNLLGTFRLSLLPPLAATAALAYRLTGSDKGIW